MTYAAICTVFLELTVCGSTKSVAWIEERILGNELLF